MFSSFISSLLSNSFYEANSTLFEALVNYISMILFLIYPFIWNHGLCYLLFINYHLRMFDYTLSLLSLYSLFFEEIASMIVSLLFFIPFLPYLHIFCSILDNLIFICLTIIIRSTLSPSYLSSSATLHNTYIEEIPKYLPLLSFLLRINKGTF